MTRAAVLERFTLLCPLWTLLAAALALPCPWLFTWLQGPLIVLALALVMLGMGLELELATSGGCCAVRARRRWAWPPSSW